MEKIINYLEEFTWIEDIWFREQTDKGYVFEGYNGDLDVVVEILVTLTGYVYFNGEKQDITFPFNVWSL